MSGASSLEDVRRNSAGSTRLVNNAGIAGPRQGRGRRRRGLAALHRRCGTASSIAAGSAAEGRGPGTSSNMSRLPGARLPARTPYAAAKWATLHKEPVDGARPLGISVNAIQPGVVEGRRIRPDPGPAAGRLVPTSRSRGEGCSRGLDAFDGERPRSRNIALPRERPGAPKPTPPVRGRRDARVGAAASVPAPVVPTTRDAARGR